jgi:hypothetical protein
MAVKFLKPSLLQGADADDDYLRKVLTHADTTQSSAQIKALHEYGIKGFFGQRGTKADIIREIDAGYPVGLGFLHHGHVSAPRGGGHWLLAIGYTPTHVIVHDPWGELDVVNGGFVPGKSGKNQRYSWKNFLPRWEVEGPSTGWSMSFRRIDAPVKEVWPGEDASVARLKRISELQLLIRKYTEELLKLNIEPPPPKTSK